MIETVYLDRVKGKDFYLFLYSQAIRPILLSSLDLYMKNSTLVFRWFADIFITPDFNDQDIEQFESIMFALIEF